jgi:hypothetical protein
MHYDETRQIFQKECDIDCYIVYVGLRSQCIFTQCSTHAIQCSAILRNVFSLIDHDCP